MKKKKKHICEVIAAVFNETEQLVEILFPTCVCVPARILD